jgi:hypothetical protein
MAALLRQCCVVDDQKPGLVSDKTVGLLQQGCLKRCAVPHPVGDKMMKLVIAKLAIASRHRLNTLAVTGTNQACDVRRAKPNTNLVLQSRQKWCQPPSGPAFRCGCW